MVVHGAVVGRASAIMLFCPNSLILREIPIYWQINTVFISRHGGDIKRKSIPCSGLPNYKSDLIDSPLATANFNNTTPSFVACLVVVAMHFCHSLLDLATWPVSVWLTAHQYQILIN